MGNISMHAAMFSLTCVLTFGVLMYLAWRVIRYQCEVNAVVIEERQLKLRFYVKNYNLTLLCCSFAPICLCLVKGNHAYYTVARVIELAIKLFCMAALLYF